MMQEKERLFLTVDEALDALKRDFAQYPIQLTLLEALVPLAFGEDAYLIRKPGHPMVWIKIPDLKQPQPLQADRLGPWIVRRLRQRPIPAALLARICTRVFQTSVKAASGSPTVPPAGVWVDTGMEDFTCVRCGRCCRTLNYRDGCSVADYRRWRELGRDDILQWVGVVRRAGKVSACRIWMAPGTNHYATICPWLRRSSDRNRHTCTIHDVRPTICRQYPGSRKHARMTGCSGV